MKTSRSISILAGVLVLSTGAFSVPPAQTGQDVAVTIYNDNFGVVKERREMTFEKGLNRMQYTGVAERIDPTSVNFLCVSSPDAVSILEQNYEYDLVNTDSLLKRYIDQPVSLLVKGSGSSGASLLSGVLTAAIGGDLIVQDEATGQMHIVSRSSVEQIQLDKKPEDLLTRPTLVWLAHAEQAGKQLCQVTYTTDGIGWKADYSAVLNDKEDKLDFSGWVTINNQSGAAYNDATIKLIAGDVRRVQPPMPVARPEMMMARSAVADMGFEEKAFMEYHLYTLGRKSTIQNRQIKQIELVEPVREVPVDKQFVFSTSINEWMVRGRDKVQVKIEFENNEDVGLGIALPKGKVRVFKADPADGTLEFVGEDAIDHTARRERLSLYIGDAFDIVPEQKITDQRRGDRFVTFTRSVEIRNRKPDEAVSVFVDEIIPERVNWKIDRSSLPFEKKDAFTCRFKVNVAADSAVTLVYTMTQTW